MMDTPDHIAKLQCEMLMSRAIADAQGRLGEEVPMKTPTNFDRYLDRQTRDPEFAARYRQADAGWAVVQQLADLRHARGISQRELARRASTTQQQISRMESPDYEGHSLSALRRVVAELGGSVRVVIEPAPPTKGRSDARSSARRRQRRAAYNVGPDVSDILAELPG